MDFVFVCCVDVSLLLFDGVFSLMFLLSVAPPGCFVLVLFCFMCLCLFCVCLCLLCAYVCDVLLFNNGVCACSVRVAVIVVLSFLCLWFC